MEMFGFQNLIYECNTDCTFYYNSTTHLLPENSISFQCEMMVFYVCTYFSQSLVSVLDINPNVYVTPISLTSLCFIFVFLFVCFVVCCCCFFFRGGGITLDAKERSNLEDFAVYHSILNICQSQRIASSSGRRVRR